jgi:hypothetical protein
LAKLVEARRTRLAEIFSQWAPEKHEKLAELVGQLMRELVADAPTVGSDGVSETAPRR